MRCGECSGSGACDPCDGYGTYPDSSPNAGDGPECEICDGTGRCPECDGTGETNNHNSNSNDSSGRRGNEGVMTTSTNTQQQDRTGTRTATSGVGRLVRRIERERRTWSRQFVDEVPTEQAWRAGVAEGLRLAQVAIRKGV